MTTPRSTPMSAEERQTIILKGISWKTYESLLADLDDRSSPHLAYTDGDLQIMVLSGKHEKLNRALALLIEILAEEMGIDVCNFGSTTFKKTAAEKGFEPDSCFYIQNEEKVRDKSEIDLAIDPPPDLVIEIDVSHPSLNKFPIIQAVGVPEIWRCTGKTVTVWLLGNKGYQNSETSSALPGVTAETITRFLQTSQTLKRTQWLKSVREWARTQFPASDNPTH